MFQKLSLALATVAAMLAVSLLSGCSKSAPPEAAPPKSVSLGVVELSYNNPSRQDLGDGAVCVLTATPLDPGHFELIAVLERSGKNVGSTRALPVPPDQPLEISFGSFKVGFVPHIK
jgi:hypothetical protein